MAHRLQGAGYCMRHPQSIAIMPALCIQRSSVHNRVIVLLWNNTFPRTGFVSSIKRQNPSSSRPHRESTLGIGRKACCGLYIDYLKCWNFEMLKFDIDYLKCWNLIITLMFVLMFTPHWNVMVILMLLLLLHLIEVRVIIFMFVLFLHLIAVRLPVSYYCITLAR